MDAIVRAVQDDQARVNITWGGQNGDLPDPVYFDSTDGDVRQWVTEAVRSGSVPGIPADPNANFTDFVVDRYSPNEQRPYNLIQIRPKTPFGSLTDEELNRRILRSDIERMSKRELNESALNEATRIAEKAWKGTVGAGQAARIGLEAVESKIYK